MKSENEEVNTSDLDLNKFEENYQHDELMDILKEENSRLK